MKRSSLKRSSPLGRKSPLKPRKRMKRGPSRRVARKTAEDAAYTAWIHTQPCVGKMFKCYPVHRCRGLIQQAHGRNLDGPTGLGLKEPDRNSVPMCAELHQEFDEHRGWFSGWSKERRREWMGERVIETRARYEAEFRLGGGVIPDAREAP